MSFLRNFIQNTKKLIRGLQNFFFFFFLQNTHNFCSQNFKLSRLSKITLRDLKPRTHRIVARRSEKQSFVRINRVISLTLQSPLSAIKPARCLWRRLGESFYIFSSSVRRCVAATIMVKIYWDFRLFPRFSKFEVRARKSISGYLLNVIGYFNLGGVDRLPGYILSLVGPFLNFWILRS